MDITNDFSALGLSDQMLEAIRAKGFETPTSIQQLTIPRLLAQTNDIIAQSQTGTGKTAAFGLPILQVLEPAHGPVQAIVLVPTRELALQAAEELLSLNQQRRLSITAIYGGAAMSEQLRRLSKGVDIVVGTPGRVLDHIRRGTLKLDKVRFLVLDEADEMLNMGFVEDVEQIISHAGEDRRVMLFSATMPDRIVRLSKAYMRDTEIVRVQARQLTVDLTQQIYFEVREADKFDALTRIIDVEPDFYGIVFARTKIGADEMTNRLLARGYAAEALHGDVSQAQREKILRKFRDKAVNILVATDVAARGIDIGNLTHVINYSLPQDSESYVHRIGRTGRAGKQGTAITFISPSEFRSFNNLMRDIKVDIKKETLPSPQDVIEMKRMKIMDDIQEIVDGESYDGYTEFATGLLARYTPEIALGALLRLAFRNELDQNSYPEIRSFSVDRKGTARLFLSVGKRDGFTARKLVDMLKTRCGLRDKHIEDIHLSENFSFVSVPFQEAEMIVGKLNKFNRGRSPLAKIADSEERNAPERPRRQPRREEFGSAEPAAYDTAPAPRTTERVVKKRAVREESAPEKASPRKRSAAASSAPDPQGDAPQGEAAPRRKLKAKPEAPDFSKTSNEGFDWSAFMKYDEEKSWGRGEKSTSSSKSVRKTPKTTVTAAERIAAKGRKR